jgi:LPPG:FO 2-phospho-L-lactate transferase
MYTLAGIANREWGWGIEGETWNAAAQLKQYGEDDWFRLGDRDLAAHVVRTDRLRRGEQLTEVCRHLQRSLGVAATILPMADVPVRTRVRTDEGWLEFQDYFVRRHQEPTVHEVRFEGVEAARVTPEAWRAFEEAEAVVIAPSNPIVSIGPILAVPGVAEAIGAARRRGARVVAVSGIIGGRALKGPADRMLTSLGHESSALGVARLYAPFIDVFVLDQVDIDLRGTIDELGLRTVVTDTVMTDDAARRRLAAEVVAASR